MSGGSTIAKEGQVRSGNDFFLSSLIFQHSAEPDGILLAHILRVTATRKREREWQTAGGDIHRSILVVPQSPQVFGTQFKKDPKGQWTMEPYAKEVLSDAERAVWCVVALARQQEILQEANQGQAPPDFRVE